MARPGSWTRPTRSTREAFTDRLLRTMSVLMTAMSRSVGRPDPEDL